ADFDHDEFAQAFMAREGHQRDEAEMEALLERLEARREMIRALDVEFVEAMADAREAMQEGRKSLVLVRANAPRVALDCDGADVVSGHVTDDGTRVMVICRQAIHAEATRCLAG